jgi:ketosteroid isomerase-like protein
MRKSSWIVLGICVVLLFCLGFGYLLTRTPPGDLNQQQAQAMIKDMQSAVRHKDVDGIMRYIAPDDETTVANLKRPRMRMVLAQAFRAMPSPQAQVNNLMFASIGNEATVDFDLKVKSEGADFTSDIYQGHITLHLKRVPVPHLWGLYHTSEWRIVGGSTTGPDPNNYGDY